MCRTFKSTAITTMTSIVSEKEWLERSIEDDYIQFYPYEDFKNICCIGQGGFGVVSGATISGITVAYKLITNSGKDEYFKSFVNNDA